MSTNDERVAAQISQMADDAPAPVASESEIAESALAHTGLGVTEADINGILAQLADFKRQLDAQAAATKAAAPDALTYVTNISKQMGQIKVDLKCRLDPCTG